jgi:replicative DNA helicase
LGETIDKALPHDDLMERAVLGAILAGRPQSIELLDILSLYAAGSRPDLLAVHDELTRHDETEAAGGIAYVASLCDSIPFKSDVLYVLRGLRRMAAFRQAVHLAENIEELALEQGGSAESLLDSAAEKFSSLARDLESTEDDGTPYFDSASQAFRQ